MCIVKRGRVGSGQWIVEKAAHPPKYSVGNGLDRSETRQILDTETRKENALNATLK